MNKLHLRSKIQNPPCGSILDYRNSKIYLKNTVNTQLRNLMTAIIFSGDTNHTKNLLLLTTTHLIEG